MIDTKRYSALFLVIVLFLSNLPIYASAQMDFKEVDLPVIGNIYTKDSISTLYVDKNLYASIQDLSELVEAEITFTTGDYVAIKYSHGGSFHNFYYKEDCIKAFLDEATEIYSVVCPQRYYNDTVYVSVLHFLHYLGIDSHVVVTQNMPTLLLYRQYSMFDILGEYVADNSCYWFDLEESGIIEDYKKAALLTLISSDPNLIKMLFDAEGIYREGIEDTLIEIIRNEGDSASRDNPYNFDSLETASDGLGLADKYLEMLEDSFEKDGIPIDGVTKKYIDKIGLIANLAPIATGYLHARLYDNMTTMQQRILSETIIGNQRYSTILTDDTGSLLVDAAEKVHIRINDAYMNYSAEAIDKASDNLYEAIMRMNSITAADVIMQGYFVITETLIPDEYEYAEAVNHSFNCYMIQVAASEIFHGLFDEFCENYFFIGNTDVQTQYLRQMKYALILQLKAAITLRDNLIEGNCLDEDGALFAQLENNHATDLLVRLESAEEDFPFELDLSNVSPIEIGTTPALSNDQTNDNTSELSYLLSETVCNDLTQPEGAQETRTVYTYNRSGKKTSETYYYTNWSYSSESDTYKFYPHVENLIYQYDENGYCKSIDAYWEGEDIAEIAITCDDEGRILKQERHFDGFHQVSTWTYDEHGSIMEWSEIEDGVELGRKVCEYNANGDLLIEEFYLEGVFRASVEYTYNEDGHLLQIDRMGKNGNIVDYGRVTYDDSGKVTDITYFNSDHIPTGTYYTYTYDDAGCLAKQYEYENGELRRYHTCSYILLDMDEALLPDMTSGQKTRIHMMRRKLYCTNTLAIYMDMRAFQFVRLRHKERVFSLK